ncbi:MAG: hypothetical protein ABJR46_08865 [Tateyamaria sp.]|uniref:hypothetical protein n=1 Tax=Tateyamaria sp. TaxID=1929288 RepID=UPI00329DA92E
MTYTKAFQEIKARADFAEISGQYLGNYSQMTGEVATTTMASRTSARPEAKEVRRELVPGKIRRLVELNPSLSEYPAGFRVAFYQTKRVVVSWKLS